MRPLEAANVPAEQANSLAPLLRFITQSLDKSRRFSEIRRKGTLMTTDHLSGMLNQIQYEKAFAQIGQRGFLELMRLNSWLEEGTYDEDAVFPNAKNIPPWRDPRCRYASSLICRNEADLFGISLPRFAIRVYLPGGGFVNARRIGPFCQQAQDWFITEGRLPRTKPNRRSWWHPWRSAARILERNSCIADALLPIPKRLRDEFYILSTRLGRAYGECREQTQDETGDQDFDASVFVKPIHTGGGLCAQSVCFLVTSLLHAETLGVHGMAEVTLLATGDAHSGKMALSGLELAQMVNYFSDFKVGLRASIQKSQVGLSPEVAFRRAMRCYLLSNFPIILPVDSGRMQGHKSPNRNDDDLQAPHICQSNSLVPAPSWQCRPGQSYPHAILIVGCGRLTTDDDFVLHDTARFPFMRATAEQLYAAGAYLVDVDPPMSEITSGIFLPVVPEKVRMPLTNWLSSEEDGNLESSDGIMQLAAVLQNPLTSFHKVAVDCAWRLSRLEQKSIETLLKSEFEFPAPPDIVQKACEFAASESEKPVPWIWLQWDSKSAWIWEAQIPGPSKHVTDKNQAEKYLKFAAWKRESSEDPAVWKQQTVVSNIDSAIPVSTIKRTQSESENPDPDGLAAGEQKNAAQLTLSLLSSYSVLGARDVVNHWPEQKNPCEYYAFMQEDAEHLLDNPKFTKRMRYEYFRPDFLFALFQNNVYRAYRPKIRLSPWEKLQPGGGLRGLTRTIRRAVARRKPLPQFALPHPAVNALDRMAALCDDSDAIEKSAKGLDAILKNRNIELIGLSSFLPGLGDYEIKSRRIPALESSKFILRLAKRLREHHKNLRVVTLAGGSRIYGMTRERASAAESHYFAWILDPEKAVEQFVKSLLELAPLAADAGVRLAVEYEPSPLRILNSPAMLEHFVKSLLLPEHHQSISSIGLNLDVAYWGFLDRLSPSSLATSVKSLICHAHCSSVGRGFYGHAPVESGRPTSLQQLEEFSQWLGIIQQPGANGSGYVSLELEACKHRQMIHSSIFNLRQIPGVI